MRPILRFLPLVVLTFLFAARVPPASASNGGAALCVWPSGLRVPFGAVAESDSGALVIYLDTRDNGYALYAQRVDRHGHPVWAPGGILIRALNPYSFIENIISDGAGGCIVAWDEDRGATGIDVVVQRVLSNGTLGYASSGLVVCNAAGSQGEAQLVDGPSGSYYVVWKDDRRGLSGSDTYGQRITVAGAPQWTVNGIAVNSAGYYEAGSYGSGGLPEVTTDLQGGLLVTWIPDVTRIPRVQRANSAGSLLWGADGVEFAANSDDRLGIGNDGSGGAWIAYSHYAPSPTAYPYLQHVVSAGTLAFTKVGIPLNMIAVGDNFGLAPVRNASGGCMVYGIGNWGSNGGYCARQEVDASGTLLRGYGDDVGSGINNMVVTDLGNGVTLGQTPNLGNGHYQLVLKRYGYDGTSLYNSNGLIVGRDEPGLGFVPAPCAGLGSGITIQAFADARYSTPSQAIYQLFGQAFDSAGNPLWDDAELPAIQSVKDAPGDQGGLVRADWNAGVADAPGAGVVTGYRAWRSVPGTVAERMHRVHPTTDDGTFTFENRTWLARANAYWEMVGEEPAARLAQYALTVPTGMDSTAASSANESFMIEAYDDASHIWWSGVLTGHSVDNLAPPALPSAAGYYASGSTTLYWGGSSASDLCCYDVYRGNTPGFVASDATRIGTTTEVTFNDPHAPAYYRIGARDIHGNRGPTTLVLPNGTTAVDGDAAPRVWRLRAEWNRSAAALSLVLDVPQADNGSIDLYDVAGRRLWGTPFRVDAARTLSVTTASLDRTISSAVVFARVSSASGHTLVARALILH